MIAVSPIRVQAGFTGFESPAADYAKNSLSLDELLINKPSATYFAVADGESMQDAGIFSGDILIVDRSAPIRHMSIVVGALNGVFVCKRLDKKHKTLFADNDQFPPYQLQEGDEFTVEGVVIRSVRIHEPLNKLW